MNYNPTLAKRLLEACNLAYQSDSVIRLSAALPVDSTKAGTRALWVLGDPSCVILAFRGSANEKNWQEDFDAVWSPWVLDGCKISDGFYRALPDAMFMELAAYVHNAAARGLKIYVTGHSLGGAMAVEFAARYYIVHDTVPFDAIYTFGQPRVGNRLFAKHCDAILGDRHYRVVHADDIVPRVPWLLGGYRHAGHEVFYGDSISDGRDRSPSGPCSCDQDRTHGPCVPTYMVDPRWLQDKLRFDIRNAWRELKHGKLALLADHHIGTYLALFGGDGAPSRPGVPNNCQCVTAR